MEAPHGSYRGMGFGGLSMILMGNRKVLWGLGEKNPRLPDSAI